MYKKVSISSLIASLLIMFCFSGSSDNIASAESIKVQNDEFSGIKKIDSNKIVLNSGVVVTKLSDERTIATDEDGSLEFEVVRKSENALELKNLKTGEVKEIKINSEVYYETPLEQAKTDAILNKESNVSKASTFAAGPPKGSVNGYKYKRTTKNNTIIASAQEGAIVAIILSVCGPLGTAAGIAYSIAGVYKAAKAKMMYWKERTYTKQVGKWQLSVKTQYNYYKDSGYKKYIKNITKYKTYQGGGI
ncbi:hypothetical protein Q0N41_19325 [Bacillus altitudinis]|uniref:hypothetical protein n=1 Tax=Bacillus altitudinis TaxID=293387 RepID=UPI00345AFF89